MAGTIGHAAGGHWRALLGGMVVQMVAYPSSGLRRHLGGMVVQMAAYPSSGHRRHRENSGS